MSCSLHLGLKKVKMTKNIASMISKLDLIIIVINSISTLDLYVFDYLVRYPSKF